MKLTDFNTLTFDVYGTLIDWESGMLKALEALTLRVPGLTRNAILEAHAVHESAQQAQTPAKRYQALLPMVYRRLAEQWGIPVAWDECLAYGQSVRDWPAFPDSRDALKELKRHFKLVVLSNVDNESFSHSSRRLDVVFDAVYTAEDAGSYKPADRNFDYMLANLHSLGVEKQHVLHTAESMFHDHVPANRHGLASCHIYRRHAEQGFGATRMPEKMPSVQFQFNSMAEMAAAVQRELSGQA